MQSAPLISMSRLRLAAFALLAIVAVGRPAAGDEITFAYGEWGGTAIGDAGFLADIFLWSYGTDGLVGGGTIQSDDLVSRTFGTLEDPVSRYEFGRGMFTAELSYRDGDGTVTAGTFAAPFIDLSFGLNEDILLHGGDGYSDPGVHAVTHLELERGFFSPALAKALHIHRKTVGGEIDLYIEGVGTPISEPTRFGVSSTQISITVIPRGPVHSSFDASLIGQPIPEPTVLALLGTALLGAGVRHRRRRAQPDTNF